jgi:amino acid adenylation domain-containing protein
MEDFEKSAVETSLPARFEAEVRRSADHIAPRSGGLTWTYGELNRGANRVAREFLPGEEAAPQPVLLLIGHGDLEILALLAVLKSGRAWVALDPSSPPARLKQIAGDVGADLILTWRPFADLAAELAPRVEELPDAATLLRTLDGSNGPTDADLNLDVGPDALASLVYTSGSTGTPKGVMRSHRCSLHRRWLFHEDHRVGHGDRIAHLFSCGFVAAEVDMYGALLSGATLSTYPIRELGIGPLAEWLAKEEISLLHPPPSLWRRFLELHEKPLDLPRLKVVCLGGEAVYREDVERIRARLPDVVIEHRLSSSEASALLRYTLSPGEPCEHDVVPAGVPLPDKEILLFDREGREAAPGEIGEIVVRSRYLSPGYWRRPELTAEKFIPVPGPEGPLPLTSFHTGDLARFTSPGGPLLHLGRLDAQLKVHGYRVEPKEVEAALLRIGTLKEVAVLGVPDDRGETELLGAVVPRDPENWSAAETRRLLAEQLPQAMIPSQLVAMPELPLTPTGKIDRPRIAAERRAGPAPRKEKDGSVGTDTTGILAGIWAEVLGLERVGPDDDFFHLGGGSLLGVRLVAAVEKALGRALPLAALYRYSTVRDMAGALMRADTEAEATAPPARWDRPALSSPEYRALLSGVGGGMIPCIRPGSLVKARNQDGGRPPLFWCFNTPDRDLASMAGSMGTAQPIYGLVSGSHQLPSTDETIARVAEHYAGELLDLFPEGPFALGGNCFGGRVATALAIRLGELGKEVTHLAVMEAFPEALFTYPGRVLLLYGRQSRRRAYLPFRWGRFGWRRAFQRVPEVDWITGEHAEFFEAGNVDTLAGRLRSFLDGPASMRPGSLSSSTRALLLVHRVRWFFRLYVKSYRRQKTTPGVLFVP